MSNPLELNDVDVVITVKHDSTRAPNKNIKAFYKDKSLLDIKLMQLLRIFKQHQITIIGNHSIFDRYANQYGVRYNELPEATKSIEHMMKAVLESTKQNHLIRACVTTPFLDHTVLLQMWEHYQKHQKEYDSCCAVEKIQTHMLGYTGNRLNYGLGIEYLMSQEIEPIYCVKSGIFIFNRETAKRLRYFIGNKPFLYECQTLQSMDINDNEDFNQAQILTQIPSFQKYID